ncbi:sigma factor [Labedaea rhizosphaerae]|uniref:Sigma-70-like protein n=1 Tax=Labedaea rhizosphaerae TaxID=598644 RepID=A0A4R6SFT8_LABRH|nr:sigma factor [Labedaea rhizosphaerae]TDQ00543.1 sigma-70-like protein [Labedaea rhizosphaerae]
MAGPQSVTVGAVPGPDELGTAAFEAVVEAAIGGGTAEINQLLLWVRPALTRYCRARIGTGSAANGDVDDLVQEVCVGLLAGLSTFGETATILGVPLRHREPQSRRPPPQVRA